MPRVAHRLAYRLDRLRNKSTWNSVQNAARPVKIDWKIREILAFKYFTIVIDISQMVKSNCDNFLGFWYDIRVFL